MYDIIWGVGGGVGVGFLGGGDVNISKYSVCTLISAVLVLVFFFILATKSVTQKCAGK